VSTGALIAPFAYLGPDYDATLRKVYTTIGPERIFLRRRLLAALFSDAMADTAPLAETIARYTDQAMFDAIAREYLKGRLLLIGTTDLDAQRPVIWNIGALAASGKPGALKLFHQILRASAAIPGVFQPVMVDVELDGRKYQEMHVDGGAIAQTFLYPSALTGNRTQRRRTGQPVIDARAFIIRNGRLDPEWAAVQRRTLGIVGRAISTMTTSSGFNDVVRIYDTTRRDDIEYNLAYIGRDFNVPLPRPFDPPYMRALFDYAYQRSVKGLDWAKRPPIV
ncbi:MAG: patatin-like phospholipase family protein, partial [Burkholderiales bacterium]